MTYEPAGMFSTPHKMRLLLSECVTVQEVLNAVDADAALPMIHTYGHEEHTIPRFLINEETVEMETDTMGGLLNINKRMLDVWGQFYIPDPLIEPDIETLSDEMAWMREKWSAITTEMLALTGRGESITGHTHLCVEDPVFHGVQRVPHDERDDVNVDLQPDRPCWFGCMTWEVR